MKIPGEFEIISIPSPHLSKRPREAEIKYIIQHCIGWPLNRILQGFTYPKEKTESAGVSAHYLIPQASTQQILSDPNLEEFHSYFQDVKDPQKIPIIQFVSDKNKAWHAGVSSWKEDENLNGMSIGIEFHAPGYAEGDNLLTFGSFTAGQLALGLELNKFLKQKYDLKAEDFLAHSDIAPFRYNDQNEPMVAKTDPGLFFPWKQWAQEGIGIWYTDYQGPLDIQPDKLISWVQEKLLACGYRWCTQNGKLDLETKYCIQAFRLHWMSDLWNGEEVGQLWNIDEALLRRLYSVESSTSSPKTAAV